MELRIAAAKVGKVKDNQGGERNRTEIIMEQEERRGQQIIRKMEVATGPREECVIHRIHLVAVLCRNW